MPFFPLLLAILFAGLIATADPLPLRIGNGAEPNSLDPQLGAGVPEENILINLFEGLVVKDEKTLAPRPGVAKRWKISADKRTYHFFLRSEAKWSNGEAVTAEDFVFAWKRLLTPATASEHLHHGFYLKNGRRFSEGTLRTGETLGVRAVNPLELEVKLENPTPFFLSLLAHPSLAPLPRSTLEKFKDWTRPENLVSNGAFLLSEWKPHARISLQKNPRYWAMARVKLKTVQYFPIAHAPTEEKMFRAGQLDITQEIPPELRESWKEKRTGVFQSHPYSGVYFYALNTTTPPLDDVHVRRALTLAINRAEITRAIHGDNPPAQSFTPTGTGDFIAPKLWPRGREQFVEAKREWKRSKYAQTKPLPPIEILYNSQPIHQKVAEIIQQNWKRVLGIDTQLVNQEWKVVLESVKQRKYQVARRSWIANYFDPLTFLELFASTSVRNHTGFSHKQYDDSLELARHSSSRAARDRAFLKMENILYNESPIIPLYFYQRAYLKSLRVRGWVNNLEDKHYLKSVSLSE